MFSSQLDAASEAHIARGYVPCTPATLCLHPLHPCNAPLHPSYPALMLLLPILQFWMFSDYLLKSNICNVKLLPQMSATLHLSYFPDSPEPNAHQSSTFWLKPHLGWKFHLPAYRVQQGACTVQSSSIYSWWGCSASQFDLLQDASKKVQDSLHPSYTFPPHPSPLAFALHFFNSYLHLITAGFKTKRRFKLRNSYQAKEDEGGHLWKSPKFNKMRAWLSKVW